MRIKITGRMLEFPEEKDWIPTHSVYAMLLNRLGEEHKAKAHDLKKNPCLFTFTNLLIDRESKRFSFYFSSTDEMTAIIIKSFKDYELFRVERFFMQVTNVKKMAPLPVKESYLFKGRLLASLPGKEAHNHLEELDDLLVRNGKNKLKILGIENPELSIKVLRHENAITRYKKERYNKKGELTQKAVRIPSHYITIKVAGDYEAIQALYDIGFGQNTGSANGLLWEIQF